MKRETNSTSTPSPQVNPSGKPQPNSANDSESKPRTSKPIAHSFIPQRRGTRFFRSLADRLATGTSRSSNYFELFKNLRRIRMSTLRNESRDKNRLISAKEVAMILGVSERTIWRLHSARRLPSPVKFGGSVRWRIEDIYRWIDSGCPNEA